MGNLNVTNPHDSEQLRIFMKALLSDLQAFELMLQRDMFETGIRRIGAEQELFIVDSAGRPARLATQILKDLPESHFTTELALFNLEFNLDPYEFTGKCLSQMETQINTLLTQVREAAQQYDSDVVMIGILPTIRKSDLELNSMTPKPRYFALNDAMRALRGSDYEFRINGIDEFVSKHKSIMLEACNTSFQIHYQVTPQEFPNLYNLAQLITAPLLAISTNSPLLLGHRLWQETRIALFQQSIDTRKVSSQIREHLPRVSFGSQWLEHSVLELFQEAIAHFRVLLGLEVDSDPFECLEKGIPPKFDALQIHNGTVYRWNRPCYGILNDIAHLRIENRILPSGPTPLDEMASSALFFGLMEGGAAHYPIIKEAMDFDDAKSNFSKVARQGMDAHVQWFDNKVYSVNDLVSQELIPLAREGLEKQGVAAEDITRYMDVLSERIEARQTGASWLLGSINHLRKHGTKDQALRSLVAATLERQRTGKPVHTWERARIRDVGGWRQNFTYVEQFMTTNFVTVHPEELVDLIANLLDWQDIRQVYVEDNYGHLQGVISYRDILQWLGRYMERKQARLESANEIVRPIFHMMAPNTPTLDAISLIRDKDCSFPVMNEGHMVGTVSALELSRIAAQLLEDYLIGNVETASVTELAYWERYRKVLGWMETKIQSIQQDEPVHRAIQLMSDHKSRALAVTNEEGHFQGAISYRTLLHKYGQMGAHETLSQWVVKDVMFSEMPTATPELDTVKAIQKMRQQGVVWLPVVDGSQLVGVLSEHTLSALAATFLEHHLAA